MQKENETYFSLVRSALPPGPAREDAFNPQPSPKPGTSTVLASTSVASNSPYSLITHFRKRAIFFLQVSFLVSFFHVLNRYLQIPYNRNRSHSQNADIYLLIFNCRFGGKNLRRGGWCSGGGQEKGSR